MPCYDGRDKEAQHAENAELKERLDLATRLLCEVYDHYDTELERDEKYLSDELREWFEAHKKADKARQEREARAKAKLEAEKKAASDKVQARMTALAKLTSADRDALGV